MIRLRGAGTCAVLCLDLVLHHFEELIFLHGSRNVGACHVFTRNPIGH